MGKVWFRMVARFEWNGKLYQGKHEPLASMDL
jgi:hypothetical protein